MTFSHTAQAWCGSERTTSIVVHSGDVWPHTAPSHDDSGRTTGIVLKACDHVFQKDPTDGRV